MLLNNELENIWCSINRQIFDKKSFSHFYCSNLVKWMFAVKESKSKHIRQFWEKLKFFCYCTLLKGSTLPQQYITASWKVERRPLFVPVRSFFAFSNSFAFAYRKPEEKKKMGWPKVNPSLVLGSVCACGWSELSIGPRNRKTRLSVTFQLKTG